MPKFYPDLNESLAEWCLKQRVFWTATSPLAGKHVRSLPPTEHLPANSPQVNVSPKGVLDSSFTVLSPTSAAYVDLTGSGAETIAHLYENGRITILFNSFDTSPRILRLFCTGTVIETDHPDFPSMLSKTGGVNLTAPRAVIVLHIWSVQTACGFGVPVMTADSNGAFFEDRRTIADWAGKQEAKGAIPEYQRVWNKDSLDGLPGLRTARRKDGQVLWWGDLKAFVNRVNQTKDVLAVGLAVGVTGTLLTQFLRSLKN